MALVTSFDTLTQMFDSITKKFINETKPAFLKKINGIWTGLSYKDYRNQVKFFSTGLISMGLKQGDNVALISENRVEWPISDLALLSAKAVVVPIYPSLTAQQMEYILINAGVKYIILSNQFQLNKIKKIKSNVQSLKQIITFNNINDSNEPILNYSEVIKTGEKFCDTNKSYFDKLLTEVKPDDTATIIYTSGTTGEPKGVELSHKNFVSNLKAVASFTEVNEKDLSVSYLPLSHIFERMAGNYFIFGCGATIAYADSIDSVAENLLELKPTVVTTVPRLFEKVYAKILRSISKSSELKQKIFNYSIKIGKKYAETKKKGIVPLNLKFKNRLADKLVFSNLKARLGGRLRFFCSGGAALTKEIGEFFEAIGILIMEGYGLTETSPVIAMNRMNAYKFGTVGWVLPGVEVKIASDGEILTRGDHVMKGYYNDKKTTDEVIDKDNWFHTGDIGHLDSESYLSITDRKKNIFVSSGGKNIAPQPLENLFLSSKYIEQFVLIGDRRQFLSALIVPDISSIKEFADSNNISYNDIQELVNNEEVYKLIENDIGLIQKNLSNYERVRRFVLLEKPLSLEEGEVTPSLKIKRKVIEEKYSNLIESMYQ
jgi:long-chain acyl-CoA synthetase